LKITGISKSAYKSSGLDGGENCSKIEKIKIKKIKNFKWFISVLISCLDF
jgi:hypothetical protein